MVGVNYYIGSTPVKKLMLGSTLVWSSIGQSNDVLLSGATRITLSNPPFTKDNNKYTCEESGVVVNLGKIISDGYVAVRFEMDAGWSFYLTDDTDTNYYGYYTYNGVLYLDSVDGDGEFALQPEIGQYVVLRKVNNNLGLYITNDGVSFIKIHNYGIVASDSLNLITIFPTIVYDPQVKGISPVNDLQTLNWNLNDTLTIVNGNDFRPVDSNALGWTFGYIPALGIGELRGRSHITIFGLDEYEGASNYSDISYGVWRNQNGEVSEFNNNYAGSGIEVPEGTYLRVRTDGTLVHQEYSLDDGVTWMHIIDPLPQPNAPLYGKISTDPGEYLDGVYGIGFIQ